jgi:hypothetical protein
VTFTVNETSTKLSAQLIPWDAYGQNDDGTQQCINMRFRATLTLNDWHCDDVKTARDESAALCEVTIFFFFFLQNSLTF